MSRSTSRAAVRLACAVSMAALTTTAGCTDQPTVTGPPSNAAAPQFDVGDPIVVTTTTDAGAGSLRDAIDNAADGSTIQFDPSLAGQTITLTSGPLDIQVSLTIEGPNPGGITVSGNGASRIFDDFVPSSAVTLRNLTVADGLATGSGDQGRGGGIFTYGALTLDHALIAGNTASASGGGILIEGTLTVTNSTIAGNSAINGGGFYAVDTDVTLTNATIANNTASDFGGGYYLEGQEVPELRNTIVANNSAHELTRNCASALPVLEGVSLADDESCGPASDGLIVADPDLGDLADNGGPTQTMALLRDSPALDAGTDCTVSDDQRYVARPQGVTCDIGAFEFTDFLQTPLSIDGSVTVNPKTGVAVVTGVLECPEALSVMLHVTLDQPLKMRRVNTTVGAAGDLALECDGATAWGIALTPATGSFQNGTGTVQASTFDSQVKYVAAASAAAEVRLFWGHK